ncbi:MAG: flavodoxin reductase [Chitinophagaceae bacterium]
MEPYIVKILSVEPVTHNVKRFRIEKPDGYIFHPGQATDLSINTPALVNEKHPFTFTALEEEEYLEFTIKIYESRHGVTDALGKLEPGSELVIGDSWGAIEYKDPGVFVAGGAGVTPFIAIFRRLYKDNKIDHNLLIFSNKTLQDIILREEFTKILGNNFINTLTAEKVPGYDNRHINSDYLKEKITDFNQPFYICGPDPFVKEISDALVGFGANPESVVFEK